MNFFKQGIDKYRLIICFSIILMFFFVLVFHTIGIKITNYVQSSSSSNYSQTFNEKITESQGIFLKKRIYKGYKLKNSRDLSDVDLEPKFVKRHAVRWVVSLLESKILELFQNNLPIKLAYYSYCLIISLIMAFSFLLVNLSVEIVTNRKVFKASLICVIGFIFYLFPMYFELTDSYSTNELLAISGCIYFSFKEKLRYYMIFAIFGVLNRETGLLLAFIYPLMNYKKNYYYMPIIIVPAIFCIVNYDLFNQAPFYDPNTWLSTNTDVLGLSIFNYFGPLYLYSLLRILILVMPFLLLLFFAEKDRNFTIILCIFFIYFCALLFGTIIPNLYPYIILAPLMLILNSYSFKK